MTYYVRLLALAFSATYRDAVFLWSIAKIISHLVARLGTTIVNIQVVFVCIVEGAQPKANCASFSGRKTRFDKRTYQIC